jgi:V-type H+-transporting ATPase subunit a
MTGYFHCQLDKASIPIQLSSQPTDTLVASLTSEIDELTERIECLERQISSLSDSYETLMKRELELTEWRWVLSEAGSYFDHAYDHREEIRQSLDNDETPLLRDIEQQACLNNNIKGPQRFQDMSIGIIAGVIP